MSSAALPRGPARVAVSGEVLRELLGVPAVDLRENARARGRLSLLDPAQTLARVGREVALRFLAVVDDVQPDGCLPRDDVGDRAADARGKHREIVGAAAVSGDQQLAQIVGPRQAAGVRRQDAVGTALHRSRKIVAPGSPVNRVIGEISDRRDRMISRRDVLRTAAGAGATGLLASAGRLAHAAPASPEWEQMAAAAKKEGKVSVNTFTGQGYARILELFTQAYPDIKLEHTNLSFRRTAASWASSRAIPRRSCRRGSRSCRSTPRSSCRS